MLLYVKSIVTSLSSPAESKWTTTVSDLQELYKHLDHSQQGDMYMSYYGQLRAEGKDHAEALEETIEHFRLRNREWYQFRFQIESR